METMVSAIKKKFHERRVTTEGAAKERLDKVIRDLDLEKVRHCINYFTKRLHDCRRLGGQLTKY